MKVLDYKDLDFRMFDFVDDKGNLLKVQVENVYDDDFRFELRDRDGNVRCNQDSDFEDVYHEFRNLEFDGEVEHKFDVVNCLEDNQMVVKLSDGYEFVLHNVHEGWSYHEVEFNGDLYHV